MKQPNFEYLKRKFYERFKDDPDPKVVFIVYEKRKQIKDLIKYNLDLKKYLDEFKIDYANVLIDLMHKKKKSKLPEWLVKKEYRLGYNSNNELDLIKI